MSENRPIKEPTEIKKDYLEPECGLTRNELTNKKPNEACDDENCKAPVWCHYSLKPFCEFTQEKIESNKPYYMTTNRLCIECLSMKFCCRVGIHRSRESNKTLEQVFQKLKISFDPYILNRMRNRYTNRVNLILQEEDYDYAWETYELASILPGTSTRIEVEKLEGFFLNGIFQYNDSLIECYKDSQDYILKILSDKEAERFRQFLKDIKSDIVINEDNFSSFHPHIVPHYYFIAPTRNRNYNHYLIMPNYHTTLEPKLCNLYDSPETLLRFWNHISSALKFLHQRGYAHMDIKPSNICSKDKQFILIDLGSTAKFNTRTASTPAYLPKEFIQQIPLSSASVDWWMLAFVVAEALKLLQVGGSKQHTKLEVKSVLVSVKDNTVVEELVSYLE